MLKTLYINWLFPDTNQFVVFFQLIVSLYGTLFNHSGSNYLRNIFTAFAVGLTGEKLNSKNPRKFFIIAVDFWVLSTQDEEAKNTAEHVIMEKIFIYARACVIKILFIAAQWDLYRASTRYVVSNVFTLGDVGD